MVQQVWTAVKTGAELDASGQQKHAIKNMLETLISMLEMFQVAIYMLVEDS